MKFTKMRLKQLRKVIRESLLLEYEQYVYRTRNGQLRIKDDDGNDESADHLEGRYGHLRNGEGEVILGTGGGRYSSGPDRWAGYRPSRGGRRRRRW